MFFIILYLLSDISPWDYWNSFNDLKESVIVILNDHVIDRHKVQNDWIGSQISCPEHQ